MAAGLRMKARFSQYRSTMPIYAYACTACGHHYDRLQKLSDPDPDACPACGADAVKRQITAPSFRLSGSGWYETDFKKDGDRKRNLVEKTEGANSSDAKSDTKPATDAKSSESKPADAKTTPPPAPKKEVKVESKPKPAAE